MASVFALEPIIGEIKGEKAVVSLVTFKSVKLKLIAEEYHYVKTKAGKVTRIVLNNLRDNQSYTLRIYYYDFIVHTQDFKTISPTKLAFISCDHPELDTSRSLWNNLSQDNPDMVLHLGDNVYADKEYKSGLKMLERDSSEQTIEKIKENYREKYHKTWGTWTNLLKNSSHLMIPDDHEIADNVTPGTDTPIVKAAIDIYKEYQEELQLKPNGYSFVKKWDNTVLIMLSKLDNQNLVDLLKDILEQSKDADTLIIALSSCPIHRISGIAGWIYTKAFGPNDIWTEERIALLYDTIFEWLGDDSSRKAFLIGGDLHIGCSGVVKSETREFDMFVTSPITNHPTLIDRLYSNALEKDHQIGKYTLDIKKSSARRNYLVLDLETNEHKMEWSRKRYPKHMLNLLSVFKSNYL